MGKRGSATFRRGAWKAKRKVCRQQHQQQQPPQQQQQQQCGANNNQESDRARSVYIGVANNARWLTLRRKFGYKNDIDFVTHLLDTAELMQSSSIPKKADSDSVQTLSGDADEEKNDEDDNKNEEEVVVEKDGEEEGVVSSQMDVPVNVAGADETNDSSSSQLAEGSDADMDWKPGSSPDDILRRSPRKQSKPIKINVRRSTRHLTRDGTIPLEKLDADKCPPGSSPQNPPDDHSSSPSTHQPSHRSKKKHLKFLHRRQKKLAKKQNGQASGETNADPAANTASSSPPAVHNLPAAKIELQDIYAKRNKKRRMQQAVDDRGENVDDSEKKAEELTTTTKERSSPKREKHRKKERHSSRRKGKRSHDIRKAPQDGIPPSSSAHKVDDTAGSLPNHTQASSSTSPGEKDADPPPQRVSIKIKLCGDCNTRHLQDACPLVNPATRIPDSAVVEDTPSSSSSSSSSSSPLNYQPAETLLKDGEGGVNPTSNGAADSGEEVANGESGNNKRDIERSHNRHHEGGGTKLKSVERTASVMSLPSVLALEERDPGHGLSVVTKVRIERYTRFGPLVGEKIREKDIPDDFCMKGIWEIITDSSNNAKSYVSTVNPARSNWFRFLRPAPSRTERNLAPLMSNSKLFFVTTVDLGPGTELLFWLDDPSAAWAKKKLEKNSCGGCNLRFSHPLYYRLHCAVFHDPNFSLTIRKYHCKVCGLVVLGKENIMRHASDFHDGKGAYQCQFCKKFFLRLNYLEMHRTYGCAANPQRTRPLCDFCGRKFCQPQKLKVHIKRMHSVHLHGKSSKDKDMAEVLREFQCKLCLKLLGSRAALQRHMKEVHQKDMVGCCTCERCGKMFQNKSNLKIHMLTHSGVKPFKCTESSCPAAFTTKQCLQFHYKKVHGYTEETMPQIDRCIAYTFDAYSGGTISDPGRGKAPRSTSSNSKKSSSDAGDGSIGNGSQDDESSCASFAAVAPATSTFKVEGSPRVTPPSQSSSRSNSLDSYTTSSGNYTNKVASKGSKKWMGDVVPLPSSVSSSFNQQMSGEASPSAVHNDHHQQLQQQPTLVAPHESYEFDDKVDKQSVSYNNLASKPYRRSDSSNASLLVEAALDAAEKDLTAHAIPKSEPNMDVMKEDMEQHHLLSKYLPRLHDASDEDAQPPRLSPIVPQRVGMNYSPRHHSEYSLQAPTLRPEMAESPSSESSVPPTLHPEEAAVVPSTPKPPSPSELPPLELGASAVMDMSYKPYATHPENMDTGMLHEAEVDLNLHRGGPPPHLDIQQSDLSGGQMNRNAPSPLQEMQHEDMRHDYRSMRSPSSSFILSNGLTESMPLPHMTTHDSLRSQILSHEQGLDMSRSPYPPTSGYGRMELSPHPHQYQEMSRSPNPFEIDRSPVHSMDLSLSARAAGYATTSASNLNYSHPGILHQTLDLTHSRHSMDLSLPRSIQQQQDLSNGCMSPVSPAPPQCSTPCQTSSQRCVSPMQRVSPNFQTRVVSPLPSHHPHHPHHHPAHHHHQLQSRVMTPTARVMTSSPLPSPVPLDHMSRIVSPPNQSRDVSGRVVTPPAYQNYPVCPSPYHLPRTAHMSSPATSTYHHYSGYY